MWVTEVRGQSHNLVEEKALGGGRLRLRGQELDGAKPNLGTVQCEVSAWGQGSEVPNSAKRWQMAW